MRQEAYSHFYESFIFIMRALKAIVYSLHKDEIFDICKDGWDPTAKTRPSSNLNVISKFIFLITFLCVYKRVSHPSDITRKLEGSTSDILQTFNETEKVSEVTNY